MMGIPLPKLLGGHRVGLLKFVPPSLVPTSHETPLAMAWSIS